MQGASKPLAMATVECFGQVISFGSPYSVAPLPPDYTYPVSEPKIVDRQTAGHPTYSWSSCLKASVLRRELYQWWLGRELCPLGPSDYLGL